jgi:hypothetical protein
LNENDTENQKSDRKEAVQGGEGVGSFANADRRKLARAS